MSALTLQPDRIVDASGRAWAALWGGNLFHAAPKPGGLIPSDRWVVWSGTPAEGLFDEHTLVWSESSWTGFATGLRRVLDVAGSGRRVLVRPHARHVVSDLPSCLRLLDRMAIQNVGLLLDPASMVTPAMSMAREDHVVRILEGLAEHPGVEAVVARDELVERVCAKVWSGAVVVT